MFPAPLIGIVVALVIVGIILWALTQFPIDPAILPVMNPNAPVTMEVPSVTTDAALVLRE